jgi:hypothetical protein
MRSELNYQSMNRHRDLTSAVRFKLQVSRSPPPSFPALLSNGIHCLFKQHGDVINSVQILSKAIRRTHVVQCDFLFGNGRSAVRGPGLRSFVASWSSKLVPWPRQRSRPCPAVDRCDERRNADSTTAQKHGRMRSLGILRRYSQAKSPFA